MVSSIFSFFSLEDLNTLDLEVLDILIFRIVYFTLFFNLEFQTGMKEYDDTFAHV